MLHFKNFFQESDEKRPPIPSIEKSGGTAIQSEHDKKVRKKVDLITLPESVTGTNCGNCEYFDRKNEKLGWCQEEKVHQWVTPRQCCALWSHEKAIRPWKN